jgi:hypothetical protein
MSASAILAYLNSYVDRVNKRLMERLPGDYLTAISIDKPLNPSRNNELDVHQADTNLEFFHAKAPGNMPPHELLYSDIYSTAPLHYSIITLRRRFYKAV